MTDHHHVLSPRPPLSPATTSRPISPTTPQPANNYRPSWVHPSPNFATSSSNSEDQQLINVANSKSTNNINVEVKFSGSNLNLVVRTISPRRLAAKIVSVLEQDLSLEILHAAINTHTTHLDYETSMQVHSFTIKIGIECQLSAEDLVQHIQQTFC